MVINLPPLRERQEDIPTLANYFLAKYSERLRKKVEGFSDDALEMLCRHSYAGNVRELENMVERAVILAKQEVVTPRSLVEIPAPHADGEGEKGSGIFAEARKEAIDISRSHSCSTRYGGIGVTSSRRRANLE